MQRGIQNSDDLAQSLHSWTIYSSVSVMTGPGRGGLKQYFDLIADEAGAKKSVCKTSQRRRKSKSVCLASSFASLGNDDSDQVLDEELQIAQTERDHHEAATVLQSC
eukprot:TRINITY_DN112620_c0_g1_i1.p1 TRINITY_DN112620_c0_g1~~TRINITY_DN112620_c0_g1_i1.p1  ORF type:complete len:107 (+),score=18.09 TRINITY_DN112620_c0_g1_i1:102-422(+)